MTQEEQLNRWVEGDSAHNDEREQCCPDFSCCNPAMSTPRDTRVAFAEAYYRDDHEAMNAMLIIWLGQSLKSIDANAYIAGGNPGA